MTRLRLTGCAIALVTTAVLTGCGKEEPVVPPATAAPTSAAATPSPTPGQAMGESPAELEDGRHPVYLTKVDVAGKELTFDLVIFLTGPEAQAEWAKRNPGDPELMNDYYIVNDNPKLRTLPTSDSVVVKLVNPTEPFMDPVNALLSDIKPPFDDWPFWITVKGGKVTLMEEQYLP